MRYDVADLAGLPKGARLTLPAISARHGTERLYTAALNAILAGIAKELRDTILPAYARERRYTADGVEDWAAVLSATVGRLAAAARRRVERILRDEAERHTKRWRTVVKARVKVDLAAVVRDEDLEDYMRLVVLRSAQIITGLTEAAERDVSRVLLDGVLNSRSTAEVRKVLQARLKVHRSRAELIAVDQTSTLVSELNRRRQEDAGVASYTWSTSGDERVRPRHAKLDGREYRWGEKTGAENGDPPGKPIRCRCVARGVLSA